MTSSESKQPAAAQKAPVKPTDIKETEAFKKQRIKELAASLAPAEGKVEDLVMTLRQNIDPLRSDLVSVETMVPVEGQIKTASLFSLMGIKDRLDAMTKAVTGLIERHKFDIGLHCINREEPTSGISDPNLSITVTPSIRFNVDPSMWEKVPRELLQKRLLEGQVSKGFEASDAEIIKLVDTGVLKQSPYLKIDVRRKPGRKAAFDYDSGTTRAGLDGEASE